MVSFPAASPVRNRYHPSVRGSLFHPGDALTFNGESNVNDHSYAPTSYVIRDIRGNQVGSGVLSGVQLSWGGSTVPSFTLPTDTTGWPYGWYRIFFSRAGLNAAVSGDAVGGHNFGLVPARVNLPPNPAAGTYVNQWDYEDVVFRAVCGVGPARYRIQSPTSGTAATIAGILSLVAVDDQFDHNPTYADPVRPRYKMAEFVNAMVDWCQPSPGVGLCFYCKDGTLDGSQIFVQVDAGTSTGSKVTIRHPDVATVVETYDNLTSLAGSVTAMAGSNYIRVFTKGGSMPTSYPATAIGRANRDGGVAVVGALYPDVEWFEGPRNEPDVSDMQGDEIAHALMLMRSYVNAAVPGAKIMGPCVSAFGHGGLSSTVGRFLAAGGANHVDALSWHVYGSTGANWDLAAFRNNMANLIKTITHFGADNLPRWQTEQGCYISSSGLFNAALSRGAMTQLLIQDQFGVRKETNHYWYMTSSGFWGQDTWLLQGAQSITPMGLLFRTFGEKVFAHTYTSAVDFGPIGNDMFIGNIYTKASDSSQFLAVQAACPIPDDRVFFTVTGASGPLTVTDAWGNATTIAVTGGQFTLNVSDFPQYVDLPAGAAVTVTRIGSWPTWSLPLATIDRAERPTAQVITAGTGAESMDITIDGHVPSLTDNPSYGEIYEDPGDPSVAPVTLTWQFRNGVRTDRVLIRSGQPWFLTASLIDFDVQTLDDNGSTWTTRATWTVEPYNQSITHPVAYTEDGMTWHEYWGGSYIHDCPFPDGPVQTNAIRLYIRRASYYKTADPDIHAGGGSFAPGQLVHIQKFQVFCDELAVLDRRVVADI